MTCIGTGGIIHETDCHHPGRLRPVSRRARHRRGPELHPVQQDRQRHRRSLCLARLGQGLGRRRDGRRSAGRHRLGPITFNAKNAVCNYDLKVIFTDGDEAQWTNLTSARSAKSRSSGTPRRRRRRLSGSERNSSVGSGWRWWFILLGVRQRGCTLLVPPVAERR